MRPLPEWSPATVRYIAALFLWSCANGMQQVLFSWLVVGELGAAPEVMGAGVLSAPLAGGLAGALGPLGALGLAGAAMLVFVATVSVATRIGRIAWRRTIIRRVRTLTEQARRVGCRLSHSRRARTGQSDDRRCSLRRRPASGP